jgi:hypothetical protein
LRAKPEPTQLECLSDASFLGKLLVLPANIRLDWKVFSSIMVIKSFITLGKAENAWQGLVHTL